MLKNQKIFEILLLFLIFLSLSKSQLTPDKDEAIILNEYEIPCIKGNPKNFTYKIANFQNKKYFHLIKDTYLTQFALFEEDTNLSYETNTNYDYFYKINSDKTLYLVILSRFDMCFYLSYKFADSNSISFTPNEIYRYPFLKTSQNIETKISNVENKHFILYFKHSWNVSPSASYAIYIDGIKYSSKSNNYVFSLVINKNEINVKIEPPTERLVVNLTYIAVPYFNITESSLICNEYPSNLLSYFIETPKKSIDYYWYSVSSDKIEYYHKNELKKELTNINYEFSWNKGGYFILMKDIGCFQVKYMNEKEYITIDNNDTFLISTLNTYSFEYKDFAKKDLNISIYSSENNFITKLVVDNTIQELEIQNDNNSYYYNFITSNKNDVLNFHINFNITNYIFIEFRISYCTPKPSEKEDEGESDPTLYYVLGGIAIGIIFIIIIILLIKFRSEIFGWCKKKCHRKQKIGLGQALNDSVISDESEIVLNKKYCSNKDCCESCSEDIMFGFTFPGRLIMTFYSFQALFFLYNFILNFIFLLPGMLYYTDNTFVIILVILFYLFFASLCSNILIIPTYELLLFSFLRFKNILAHLDSIQAVMTMIIHDIKEVEIEYKKSNIVIDILLIIIEILYVLGIFFGLGSKTMIYKDIIREIIFIIIYFYYLVIFFGYLIVAIYLMIKLFKAIKENCKYCFFMHIDEYMSGIFRDKVLPDINLLCYVINPLSKDSYEEDLEKKNKKEKKDCYNCIFTSGWCCLCRWICCCSCCCNENWFYIFKNIVRPLSFISSLILAMIIISNQNTELYAYILIIIFYFISFCLSSLFNFPYMIRNIKVFFMFSTQSKFKEKYKLRHPILISVIRLVSFLIIFLVSFGLLIVYIIMDEKNNIETIRNYEFSPIPEFLNKTKLKPNICFSSIYNMYIYLYLPFINDAYYYDSNPTVSPDFYSSFQIKGYKEMFFEDDLYDIKAVKNLITSNETNKVKMVQYDVIKNRREENGSLIEESELTILAIKGTTNKKDIFLDLQLYLPSVLLNYLSYFSLLAQEKDTYSFGYLEYSLSLPYRLFSQYLIIDGYLRDLIKAYRDNKSNFKQNVVIVGHSLGGGLAKLLGKFLGKQAISLSGPGVNAFHSLWEYEGSSDDFQISQIDLVPDMDLVPRVEVSGGTIYRIICKEGPANCHGKEMSLCEVLIMCRNPNYEQYCKKMANLDDDQIEAIKKSSEL